MLNALLRRCVIVISIWPIRSVELAFSVYVCISRMLIILRADVACSLGNIGSDYLGTVATTSTGRTCRAWSAEEFAGGDFADVSVAAASNYCRNPDRDSGGLWCYPVGVLAWEYCDIPNCCELISWFPCSFS